MMISWNGDTNTVGDDNIDDNHSTYAYGDAMILK